MANVSVYNMEGSEVEKMDLNDNVFAVEVNEHLKICGKYMDIQLADHIIIGDNQYYSFRENGRL